MRVGEDGLGHGQFLGLSVHFLEELVNESRGGIVTADIDRFDLGIILALGLHSLVKK